MSSITETSASFLDDSAPLSTTNVVVGVFIFSLVMTQIIHRTSPMHLTRTLVSVIHEAEGAYFSAIEDGVLSSSGTSTEMRLSELQIKVSNIRETSLRNSLSNWLLLRDYFRGRSFGIIECIWESPKWLSRSILNMAQLAGAQAPHTVDEPRLGREWERAGGCVGGVGGEGRV
ncbi:hypothetical protein MVEN_00976600 [Mycena venus]|uniref:Uncharacterized protein n=1 Tax=Mycena venus TaxID=2733690 RepID=A0A8H6YDC9_9AGAR|nr:hypothetical protein MVEN_00976600 [Mycena venus]